MSSKNVRSSVSSSLRLCSKHPWTFCVAFFVVNALLLRNLWSSSSSDDAADDDGFAAYGNGDAENQWRLVKSRQILDFREKELLLSRKRRFSAGDNARHPAEVVVSDDDGPRIDCESLAAHEVGGGRRREFVAAGWTKAVYRLRLDGRDREVAIKQVNFDGHDMTACLSQQTPWECYRKSAAKIMKEIVLLRELAHPNVLKVLGYCIPNGVDGSVDVGGGLSLITELGQSLDIIKLLQSSWEDRLRIVLGVTRLVFHLSHSPLGPLVMNDFRRQQFVLVDGELKLSDVDDVELEEPACRADADCAAVHEVSELTVPAPCVASRCRGYNEKQNVYNAGRHFVSFLLPHGAPQPLRARVGAIAAAFENVTWDSARLLHELEDVRGSFVTGRYLSRSRAGGGRTEALRRGFRRIDKSDLPGVHDYRCQLTVSGTSCTLSVFDDVEAMEICWDDRDCRAFVVTPQLSWAGRHITHFKNNVSTPVKTESTTLYIKEII